MNATAIIAEFNRRIDSMQVQLNSMRGVVNRLGESLKTVPRADFCVKPDAVIEDIQNKVAAYFGLEPVAMRADCREVHLAWPRQIGMYLASMITGISNSRIGRQFGGRHSGTVTHARQLVATRAANDPALAALLEDFMRHFQKGDPLPEPSPDFSKKPRLQYGRCVCGKWALEKVVGAYVCPECKMAAERKAA